MKRQELRERIGPQLQTQLRLFLAICLVMLALLVIDVVQKEISVTLALLALVVGALLGLLVNRMNRLRWDEQAQTVIAQMDWIGGGILVAYLAFMFGRDWMFGHWLEGTALTAFGLGVTAGTMLGRVLGTRRGIRTLLESVGIGIEE